MRRRRGPPIRISGARREPNAVPGLIELDRFSAASLDAWKKLSADLDELNSQLYFGFEPQRQRHRSEMLTALESVPPVDISFSRWVRLVTYQYSMSPLSAAGSLNSYGGRFNVGLDVDQAMRPPWPALYIADDLETAFREKFQLARGADIDGLLPEDLALQPGSSFSAVCLDGRVEKVFDLSDPAALAPLCRVLAKMKMPAEALRISRRLKLPPKALLMVRTTSALKDAVLERNWRTGPAQFGLPSPSQVLAELVRDAGFEAIQYPSTKGGGTCLALFPDRLQSSNTEVYLADPAPAGVVHSRLSLDNADHLCGWELLRPVDRPTS